MRLIGICGFARTGKDEACRVLGGYRIAFADALKADLAPVIRDRYGLMATGLTPAQKEVVRPLFVAHGAVGRALDPDMWVEPVVERIQSVERMMAEGSIPEQPVVITDCRYVNELQRIISLRGRVIYLLRPGYGPANEEEQRSIGEILRLVQEHQLDLTVVVNDGTLADLGERLKEAVG